MCLYIAMIFNKNQIKMQTQKELLNVQSNVNEETISQTTIERIKLDDTPFYAIGNNDDGFHLICGNHRLTEFSLKRDEIDKYLIEKHWELIAQFVTIMIPAILKDETNNN